MFRGSARELYGSSHRRQTSRGACLRCRPRPRVVARDLGRDARVDVSLCSRSCAAAYANFRLGRFDLGNMVQAVWSTTQGRLLETTDGATGEQIVRLGVARRSAARAAGAAVDRCGPRRSRSRSRRSSSWRSERFRSSGSGGGISASERLAGASRARATSPTRGSRRARVGAIHPVTFAITFLLFAVWFLDSDRLVPVRVVRGARDVDGRADGTADRRPRALVRARSGEASPGALIALAGLVWSFVAVYVVVGHYRRGGSSYYGFYDEIGGSPQGVVRTLFTDPGAVLGALFEGHDVVYLIWLGLPLLLPLPALARRSPPWRCRSCSRTCSRTSAR